MISGRVKLRNYSGWKIRYYLAVDSGDADVILKALKTVGCSRSKIEDIEEKLKERCCNVGFSYTRKKLKKSFIIISKTTTLVEFINTFVHEIDHIEKHVAKTLGFSPYSERASYLVGEMVRDLFADLINKLLCRN